jgi:tripartite-type tricarboxylate transporter receptor subunit TctC
MFATASPSRAADYPTRPIKLVVPYVAGGPTDVQARLIAEYLGRDLKQTVFVENKAGAQGAIGAEAVAHADPDGYTLLFTASSVLELNPILYKKLSYDPDRELRVIAVVTDQPSIMVVHPSVPAKTIAEFVAWAKQNAGKINFGSAGTGGVGHLSGEMFKLMAGIEMTHVPYKGAGPALADLIAGQIQATFETVGTALQPIRAGLLRPLGVTSTERIAELPDLPTIAESGYPDYRTTVWYGAAAPTGVPADVVQSISASFNRVLNDEAFRASLTNAGFGALRPRSEAEIKAFIDADKARWSKVIKQLNISLD